MIFTIQKRLLFWLIVVALPIAAACFITVNLVESSLTERVIASLENDHRLETARIESELDQYKRYANNLANNRSIRTALDNYSDGAASNIPLHTIADSTSSESEAGIKFESDPQLRLLIDEISNLAQTMNSGVVEFKISTIDGMASAQSDGYSWEPADKTLVVQASRTQRPVFGDAFLNPEGEPRLGIAVPVLSNALTRSTDAGAAQSVLGIMTIEMKLGPVVDLVEAHEGMGETSESHIAQPTPEGDAEFITLLRFKRDAAFNVTIPKSKDKPINWSLESPETHVVRSPDYRNIESFLAIGTIADTGWGLVVKIDEDEAFIPLYEVTNLIWRAGMVSVLLVIISWYVLIRPLASRLQSTAVAADRLAAGDYDQLIKDSSFDEIGTVSKSIDRLASDLKADVLLRKDAEKKLKYQAEHDALTGLFNRQYLQDIAEQLESGSSQETFSVLFMDLDGFKAVNDQHGHHVGDEILVQFAAELKLILPKGSFASRWGGDEFVVILPRTQGDCADYLSRLVSDRFEKPFATSIGEKFLGCSIGVSTNDETLSVADCVKIADARMYDTKQIRKEESNQTVLAANLVSSSLKEDRIDVWYQPIVAISNDDKYELIGAEALLRIRDKAGKHLAPTEFLPYIHYHEIAIALDDIIISQAFENLGNWQKQDLVGSDFYLSVNLCGATAQMDTLPEFFSAKMKKFQIQRGSVVVELSEETQRIKDTTLAAIRKLGMKIAVDDIGLLNSNLERLASVEPDIAKFDRVWLKELCSDTQRDSDGKIAERKKIVLENMLMLCSQLGADFVIEGVEAGHQLSMSREIGIRRFQGYLFDRSLSPEQFTSKLKNTLPSIWSNAHTQYRKAS